MTYKNVLLNCHGSKIRSDPIEIPENMKIISFSTENELSNINQSLFFMIMCYEDQKRIEEIIKTRVNLMYHLPYPPHTLPPIETFADKFSRILSIFGSSLYHMSLAELHKNCLDFNIRYSKDDYKNILKVIKYGGLNRFGEQNIKYHGPGSIISNYNLSYDLYEYVDAIIRRSTNKISTNSIKKSTTWQGGNSSYYVTHYPPDIDIVNFKFGVSDLGNMSNIKVFDSLVKLKGKFSLKQFINTFKTYNQTLPITLFIDFCKREPSPSDTLQQIQQYKIQPLTLLSGIGLQQQPKLSFKSPKKIKKSKFGLKK